MNAFVALYAHTNGHGNYAKPDDIDITADLLFLYSNFVINILVIIKFDIELTLNIENISSIFYFENSDAPP